MHLASEPGTGISIVQRSGTSSQPSSRAACAGNSLRRSSVTVKIALMTSPLVKSLRATMVSSNSRVARRMSSGVSLSTVVAPRIARIGRSFISLPYAGS